MRIGAHVRRYVFCVAAHLIFTSPSTLFKSYRDDGRMIMKVLRNEAPNSQELNTAPRVSHSKVGGGLGRVWWGANRSATRSFQKQDNDYWYYTPYILQHSTILWVDSRGPDRGWSGGAKVSCIFRHRGRQTDIGLQLDKACYPWSRWGGRGGGRWGRVFYFFCFFTFIPVTLSPLSLSYISSTTSSISLLPFFGRRHKMTHKG